MLTPIKYFAFSPIAKENLLKLGQKLEKILEDKNTPQETKEKGFAANLHEEWLKQHPESSLKKSKLCTIYMKLECR